jgi:hypothetical protein
MEHYIHFPVAEATKLFTLIAPHILPCFRYKLPIGFYPQNPV